MREHWRVPQWTAYIKVKDIPIMSRTRQDIETLVATTDNNKLAPVDIVNIAYNDPFFSLRLLLKAEQKRSRSSLSKDSTTVLTCIMQTGIDGIVSDIKMAPLCPESEGLQKCERRAALAAHIAKNWGIYRADIAPDEIAMASLLSDLGELMLWLFAPELPERALDELFSGRASRNRQAQIQTAGFGFKDLSISLAEAWNLPLPVKQLMGLAETPRAKLAKCAIEAARHVCAKDGLIAIPDDLRAAREVCPMAKYTDLVKALGLEDEQVVYILEKLAEGT